MQTVTTERFDKAQNAEKGLWDSIEESFILDHQKYYVKKSKYLTNELLKYGKEKDICVLQVGCAVDDIINHLLVKEKHSIDPLADFYIKKFGKIINYEETNYLKGTGENLPYKDEMFDVIILANVLDHCKNPEKILQEAKRVLKDDGILYFEGHFHQSSFLALSKLYGFTKKVNGGIFNVCHPHMFLLNDLKRLISKYFLIDREEKLGKDVERNLENLEDLKKFLKKQKFTMRFPSYFGLFGAINYTCFCKKKN